MLLNTRSFVKYQACICKAYNEEGELLLKIKPQQIYGWIKSIVHSKAQAGWEQGVEELIARCILKSAAVFLPAQIVDGKLWFQLDCGSGPGILGISGRAVNDGSWHSVFLELNRNFTSLSLDDSYVERRRAPLYFQTLSTESTIYFGALVQADNIRSLTDTRVTQVLSGFQGCLDSVVLNNNELPLQNKRSSFAEVVGLTELKLGCVLYPDACERSPCQHGGSCAGLPSGGE